MEAGSELPGHAVVALIAGPTLLDQAAGFRRRCLATARGKLPSPENSDYTELSARLAWQASQSLELAFSGFNLLDDRHSEYALPTARQIPRSIYAEARWTF